MNNNSVSSKSPAVAIAASKEKVKSISFEKDVNNSIKSVSITYVNSDSERIVSAINKYIITSTIYDKSNK